MRGNVSEVRRKRSIPLVGAPIIVVVVGALVLVGWLLDSAVLKSVIPGLTAMNPLTAVTFILSGIALWFLIKPQPYPLSQLLALSVVGIAVLKLAEIVFGWDIGIDRLLFADKLQAESVPNRMAPNTALNFLLVGAALFLTSRRSHRLAQAVTLLTVLVAALAALGYIYDTGIFYAISTYIPMALNTAMTFLALGVGILAIQPDTGVMALWRSRATGGVLARRLTSASVLVLLIMGWLRLQGGRAGVFDPELGEALFATANAFLLIGVIWWTAQVIDRTDQKRRGSEVALGESEARYRALFENSGDAILVVDSQGRLFHANPEMERLSGYTHGELLSAHIGDLVPDLVSESGQPLVDRLIEGKNGTGELTFVRSDASEINVEYIATAVAPGLFQAIFHDISERKKAEENLRQALEQERYLNELKSRFVAMVSHEFRTPLAVIRSSTDLLLHYGDRTTPEKREERLEKIQREITLMVQLLDDILIIRKAEDSGVAFNPQFLDLSVFCTNLITEIQPATPSHRIEFSSSGDCTQVSADPKLLRQAITNLISNAIKYSPERERVQIELICGEKEIILHMRDEGIGIPSEDQERLFEVFHRASNVGSISGTGLGLPIIKQAVEAHGGSVVCASEENIGTTFTISFPRQQTA